MATRLGIAHSHFRVGDIETVATRYRTLESNAAPIGLHPRRTGISLIVLERSALETMGIHDEILPGNRAIGDFRFGRHMADMLAQRESMSPVALRSEDAARDRARMACSVTAFPRKKRDGGAANGKQCGATTASNDQHRGAPR